MANEEKSLLDTALSALLEDAHDAKDAEAEKEENPTNETAAYQIWGEEKDAEEDDAQADSEEMTEQDHGRKGLDNLEKSEGMHEEEDDGIEGSKKPDEGPSDAKVINAAHCEDAHEDDEEEKEVLSEPGYMKSDAHEDEEEVEEMSHAKNEEEDEEDEVVENYLGDEEDMDEGEHEDDEEPVKPTEAAHEDEEEVEEGEHEEEDEGELENEINAGYHEGAHEDEEDDMEEGEHEEEELEENLPAEDDAIPGAAKPDDDVSAAVAKISQTIVKAGATKAMEDMDARKFSMKEDIEALVAEDDTLSEGFKEKAATIFEAAVTSKVRKEIESLEESYADIVAEEVENIHEDLITKLDNYLTYVTEEWMTQNEEAVVANVRTELAENFMGALKDTFINHYIEMPEGKTDVFDEVTKQNAQLKESVANKVEENKALHKKLVASHRKAIIKEASEGLVDTQASKLVELTEDVSFESTSKFKKKVATIKESYFSKKAAPAPSKKKETSNRVAKTVITEEVNETPKVDTTMQRYINASAKLEREAF